MAARKGRGVDFEQRFDASRWAEDRVFEALSVDDFQPVRLGLSGYDGSNTVSTVKGQAKVPDLLITSKRLLSKGELTLLKKADFDLSTAPNGALQKGGAFAFVWKAAVAAIEVEFSPYRAAEMKGRNWQRKTSEQLEKRPLKHAKPPVAPNIFVKVEDLVPLRTWSAQARVPVFVIHVFDQEAFMIGLDQLAAWYDALPATGQRRTNQQLTSGIFVKSQVYDRTDAQGAREEKLVLMVSPAASMKFGDVSDVEVGARLATSASKKYTSQVVFSGGRLVPAVQAREVLSATSGGTQRVGGKTNQ